MLSLIFTTLGQGKSVAKEFGEAWSAVFSKTNNEAIKFSDDFTTALNKNIGYINNYKNAVDGGMSETEAMAKHLASASIEAKEYAASTKVAKINTEQFARSQKLAEVATVAQTKSLTNIRTIINTYNAGADKLGLTTEEFNKSVKESNGSLGTYLSSLNGAKASMGGYIKSLVSAKLSTIALSVASAALNAIISFGISVVIQGLITGISELVHREEKLIEKSEEAKSAIQSINDELKENSKTVNDTSERFATLAQKVEDLGKLTQNKGTLSTEEYEEFLNLSNQLAGIFPELTKGYDDNGNAILDLSGDVNTIVSSLDDLIDRQKQLANQEIIKQLPDLYSGFTINVKNARAEVKSAQKEFDRINDAYEELSKYGSRTYMFDIGGNLHDADGKVVDNINNIRGLASALGLVVKETQKYESVNMYGTQQLVGTLLEIEGNIDDNFTSKLENARKNLQYAKQNLESELSSIGSYINTWLQGEWMYNKIDDTGLQAAVQQILLSFNPSALPEGVDSDNWEAVSEWIRKNILFAISNIDNEEVAEAISRLFSGDNLSLKELEGFVELIKSYFGEDSPVYLFIKPKIAEVDDAKKLADGVKKFIKDEFDSSVDGLSLDDLAIAASDEFWKFLNVPDGTLLSLDELNQKLKEYKEISDSIEPLSFKDALSGVNALSSGLNELDKIYADIYNKEDFDWSSILDNESFTNAFSKLDEYDGVYSKFIETVANSPTDIAACQEAFDNLTTAYLKQSGILDNVTDATRNSTVAMLEQMGISNAAAIVDAKLAYQKEKLKYTTGEYTEKEYDEIVGLYNACAAGETAKQVLAELAVQKALVNAEQIKSSDDIEQIIALANAANATTASLQNLAKAKSLIASAEAKSAQAENMYKIQGDSRTYQRIYNQAQTAYKQAEKLLAEGVRYNEIDASKFKASYSGGSSTRSAKESAAKAKEETWFEKQYKLHQHLLDMDAENVEDYLNWLNSAYQQAYNEGIIDLDEFYKYQSEVYSGLKDLFKDYLNDVEHEISMREHFDGENKKIISMYNELIAAVEKEIKAARARGLDDTDDYIQELQSKWASYRKSIRDIEDDITDSARDAIDDLVDYRIDMLKKDVQNEKDALDKKLDNLKEFYDKQKEMLEEVADEKKYIDEQSEKRRSITDIEAQLAQLEYDSSAWAEKRKAELRQELADAQKELDEFEEDHALDLALDAIDNAYNSQEVQLKREMDALDERLNDPQALYNQALTDIKNNSKNQLYYTMLMYNRQYGDGKDSTVKEMWEKAYGALDEYQKLFGEAFDGIELKNETGYVSGKESWDTASVSGTNPANPSAPKSVPSTPAPAPAPAPSAPSPGSTVTIKRSATNFSGKSNYVHMASFVPGGTYTVYKTSGNEVLIGLDGVYTGWVNKSDIVGYASGTRKASAGLHSIDEKGNETIFESADGARYKMFSGGEKVLNAKASDFLYEFANGGGEILEKIIKSALGGGIFDKIMPAVNNNEINMGDIVINGDCKEKTVSEIRRAQRESVSNMLKAFNNLNK